MLARPFQTLLKVAVAASCGLGVSLALAPPSSSSNPELALAASLPADAATRAKLKRQMAELGAAHAARGGPRFSLPESQRGGWIAAWNKMRECALQHGFEGVMPVAGTYGDGRTPAPVISGSGPQLEMALRKCPFDTTLFDQAEVLAAMRDQMGPK